MYVYRLFSNGKAEFIDKQQYLLDSIQIIHEKSKTIFVPTPISYDFPRYAIYDIMTEVEKANILLQKHSTTGVNLYGIIKDLLCKLSNRLRDDYFDAKDKLGGIDKQVQEFISSNFHLYKQGGTISHDEVKLCSYDDDNIRHHKNHRKNLHIRCDYLWAYLLHDEHVPDLKKLAQYMFFLYQHLMLFV
ncbi:unnamed protein product [Rotaria socialis]|uniref:Uncharacterized protein n=1 Tax=Rotaria socialis TaxID=392032 RepID=A0A820V0L8_9BILA|nr:unnamed protein product [Rotaria socialis]